MKIVLGYVWGLWWWRTSPPDTRVADCLCSLRSIEGCRDGMNLLRAAGLGRLCEEGVSRGIPRSVPADVVVTERVGHQSSGDVVRHLSSSAVVPSGSLCRIHDGVYVFAPAYCVLQIASIAGKLVTKEFGREYALVVVAKVACEMCGTYSESTVTSGMVRRSPLLTIGELAVLSLDMARVHGAGLLRATLPFVIENLRSPKEADVFLLLCLPARLGGFALPRPLSNYAIDVSWVRDGFFAGWTSCEVDLFWGQARLVVEYDSWDHHDERGQEKLEHDRERADALRAMGFTVVTIRRNDLYSPRLFRAKAEEVANSLGGELPAPMSEFLVANERLRRMLLRHDRWA